MQRTRQAWTVAALVTVILLIVAGVWFLVVPKSASATGTRLTATVQQGRVTSSVTATGNLEPLSESNPTFGASGTVATVSVALGQTVTAGQVLGTLDPTPLSAALATAQTALNDDEAILADAQSALTDAQSAATTTSTARTSTSGGSAQSVSSAQQAVLGDEQKVSADQGTVNQDTQNVADATLTAPGAGLIVAVNGAVGQQTGPSGASATSSSKTASAGGAGASGASGSGSSASASSSSSSSSGFVTIADTSKMTVPAEIAEADIASVSVGQAATVTFPAVSGVTATAKVTAIAPEGTASNSIVTYPTTITLDSIPTGVRLGQTADVSITTKSSPANALYVPAVAITSVNGTSTVKVLSASGTVTTKQVKLGVAGTQGTQITSGLKAGQTIVLGTVSATTTTGTGTGTSTGTGTGTGTGGQSRFGGSGFRGAGGFRQGARSGSGGN
jgi:macrolide-specific efflux system membrane fusion protein